MLKRIPAYGLLVVALVLGAAFQAHTQQATPEFEFKAVMVEMRDGVKLNTHIFTPKGQTSLTGPLPMILERTPYQAALGGNFDIFLTRLDASGQRVEFSTYLGGTGLESTSGEPGFWFTGSAGGLAVDQGGNAVLTGRTMSRDFPVKNAFQPASPCFSTLFIREGTHEPNPHSAQS